MLGVLAAAAAAAVLPVGPPGAGPPEAAAHPFGPPPVARLRAEGNELQVRWTAAPDDVLALGYGAGVVPARPAALEQADGAPFGGGARLDPADAARIADAPAVVAYLTERVRARQDGTACPGAVRTARDLVEEGAVLTFTCPRPVETVEVEIALLTDLHPAYRTMAVSDDGQRALYTADDATEPWTFGGGGAGAGGAAAVLVGGAAVLAAGAGGLLLHRRRSRRRSTARGWGGGRPARVTGR